MERKGKAGAEGAGEAKAYRTVGDLLGSVFPGLCGVGGVGAVRLRPYHRCE